MLKVKRYAKNPILKPSQNLFWERDGVFNGCPVEVKGKKIKLLYRALSPAHYHASAGSGFPVSEIGMAESRDGLKFSKHQRFIWSEEEWERFGCEDPRVVNFEGKYYIFYTALSKYPFEPSGIKVGLAISRDLKKIDEKHLITPFNAKAMSMFPERIGGKIWTILTPNTDNPPSKIACASFNTIEEMYDENKWNKWYENLSEHSLDLQRRQDEQVELGAPPLKTKYGWLIIYSHIQNYYSRERIFGVEAALLSLKDPGIIISKTTLPIMVPEADYEFFGTVPNVVFPSGALLAGKDLRIYYGAADSTCCVATVDLKSLAHHMFQSSRDSQIQFERAKENPVLSPIKEHSWEAQTVFNPAAIYEGGRVHMVYRAMSDDNTSVFGYASSKDGINFDERLPDPIYVPREDFEQKLVPGGNSGCEDPRLTVIGETVYMCYTAFDGRNPPRVALTSIPLKSFLAKKWDWAKPVLISPPNYDDKDACVFPQKVKGKYLLYHRLGSNIDVAFTTSLKFDGKTWLEETIWMQKRPGFWDSKKIGIAAPPLKTKAGWILLYHGVSQTSHFYRVGAVLLDLKNPLKIIARTDYPIFEPREEYELKGIVPNVVFPDGAVIIDKKIFMYYGGADKVIGLATMPVDKLIKLLLG